MSRRAGMWRVWLLYAGCALVTVAAMAWMSTALLRLERGQYEAQEIAAREEAVRLALWRMDSAVLPLLAEQNSRPHTSYRWPNNNPPSPDAELTGVVGDPPVPVIKAHFDLRDGNQIAASVPGDELPAALRDHADLASLLPAVDAPLAMNVPPPQPSKVRSPQQQTLAYNNGKVEQQRQDDRNYNEYQQRSNTVLKGQMQIAEAVTLSPVVERPLIPIVRDGQLALARLVHVNGSQVVQGCWLDWPALRGALLDQVRDLLPDANLILINHDDIDQGRRLASLPLRLAPGAALATTLQPLPSAVRPTLLVAWACVLGAVLAAGLLLRGALVIADRRAAFVSAVTHELRTPLTTFRLYTEMLSDGRVKEADRQREYLQTLRVQAERLSHLVENVLAHARLEHGRTRGQLKVVGVAAVLERVEPTLRRITELAGMTLCVDLPASVAGLTVSADPLSVEQILVNLVDNACKYAAKSEDRRVHLRVADDGASVTLSVCDHGPGLSNQARRKLFQPFSKPATEAAATAPGVGLGLAISRRLARAMGGDLQVTAAEDGACFVLRLRCAGDAD